ncbi:cellulase family glycosylhydrolase [Microbacterium sp. EYE_5]|uniref:cellulase family glycosylhydrolase n=1 Tax=unclassified Microbacterium TaxID=2609290 RepID=UPI00200644B3|nr:MULTISPECIES: cellulase family glycosylhydrolase [unclassified Microbacterium]MCK6079106.1 cellulase family glycosylhydrolase [Microbacterium sp. EYE_382]MCK6084376.1 cellulase family glycosylhydrolase [Microbacterium sp. EYE_384]MCK6123395.1 cellulase family glycosylhydrolase [Microbacterium sp. EYE_80]MCK6125140.1 cellulase family glycosylhydrolase [Microbacterium sp. EYE_79]MCK6140060.1 cellulase family glycosylhydrolase [Microbacterium sp. EYE_39]
MLVAVALTVGSVACAPEPSVTAETPTPSVQRSASAKPLSLPRTARAEATVDHWRLAAPEAIAEVAPEVGYARAGALALGIDAPVIRKAQEAASASVDVQPGTVYDFSAWVRVASVKALSLPASFTVSTSSIGLGKVDSKWKRITGTYTTGAAEHSLRVGVKVTGAVRGMSVDGVSLIARSGTAAGVDVVPNGSFEGVGAKRGILNRSLVMTTRTASVAVALPAGTTTWEAKRSGKRAAGGSVKSSSKITALPLSGLAQGLYSLTVKASDKKTVSTTIAVVDSPNPWITLDRRFGVGLHVENAIYRDSGRHARALGIAEARNDIYWQLVEKKKGAYDWNVYAAPLDRLAAQGVKTLGIVGYGNALYGNQYAPRSKAAIAAYGKYSAAVAKRFDLVGIEVFNEFNHKPKNPSGCTTAACYLPLLRAVDSSVGKVDPKLPIVAGSTARYDAKWFDDLWKRGGLKHADAVSFHPYETTGNPEALTGIMSKSRASMKKFGKANRPVWVTELGTSSRTGNRTQTEQASVLMRSSVTALASGAKQFYWYDLINDGPNPRDQESNFGLYEHPKSSVAGLAPKQAGFAQALTITQLGGRSYRAADKAGAGVVSRAFGPANDTVRVVWSPKGKKTATIRTTSPVVVVNFDGSSRTVKPKSGVVKVQVTTNPIFIRSGKATAGVTK